MSIWLACCNSQSLSSTKTLCGPSVVTMLQAAWCGHVCHIPFVISPDGRVAWWLSSRHIWMMLRCLKVWQWLALLTVSSLIHLVQRVCVLKIGRHLILPLPLLSACLASVSLCAPMTCLMYNHFPHCMNIFQCVLILQNFSPRLQVCCHYIMPRFTRRTEGKEMCSVRITAPLSYYPCFTFSSPYFHWEEHWPHLWGQ